MLIEDVNTANIEHMQFGFGWSGYSTGAFTIGKQKWSRSAETSKPPRLIAETHRHSSGKQELPVLRKRDEATLYSSPALP